MEFANGETIADRLLLIAKVVFAIFYLPIIALFWGYWYGGWWLITGRGRPFPKPKYLQKFLEETGYLIGM